MGCSSHHTPEGKTNPGHARITRKEGSAVPDKSEPAPGWVALIGWCFLAAGITFLFLTLYWILVQQMWSRWWIFVAANALIVIGSIAIHRRSKGRPT
ncbi:hypothetical protein DXT87_16415 [Arthrobacter sp. AET 35A]|nr:hypothetical protein [Arthrobacter sp. AET 35A]